MVFGVCPLMFPRRLLSVFYSTEKRLLATASGNTTKKALKIPVSAPQNVTRDWIGPPDKQSNLRPVHFFISPDETAAEKNLRLQRKALQDFNQNFWSRQNIMFFKKKSEFIQAERDKRRLKKQTLSPEEMATFYKQFLQENYQNNLKYHREWYKRNIMLLWPALKVALERLLKRIQILHMKKIK